ncbi:hypothetical protein V6N11_024623 [Hibiscus sabdariffa]|uniref:BRCT domain-containing protein n=1 Tax=Hibiscus sabdariffa TaxID=183260 RepID=A0ABR2QMQ1_9ROSI
MNGVFFSGIFRNQQAAEEVVYQSMQTAWNLTSSIKAKRSAMHEGDTWASAPKTKKIDDDHSDDGIGHVEPSELDNEIVLDSEDEGSCRITSRSENLSSRKSEGRIPCSDAADSIDKQLAAAKGWPSVRPNSSDEVIMRLEGVDERTRIKSPLVSGAKGTQRLAKIIKPGSPVKEMGAFEWIESCQQAKADTFIKRGIVSSEFGDVNHQDLHSKGSRRLSNKHEEELARLHNDMKGSSHSLSIFKDQCSEVSTGIEKESEGNYIHGSFKEFDEVMPTKSSSEKFEVSVTTRDVPDLFDVGIGTQIASEVMEALYYGLPPSCNTGDTCEVAACETGEVAKESIRRKRSARRYNKDISSSSWNYDYQMLSHKIEPNGYKCKQSKVDESYVDYKRKRKRVVANPPPKLLSGKQKCSKLHSYASTEASDGKPSEQQQSSPEEAAIARLLRLEVPIHSRGESNMHASFTSVGAEEQNLDSVRSQKLPEDGETNSCDGTNSDLAVANISAWNLDRAKAAETAKLDYVDSTSSTNGLKNHNFGESPRNSIESSGTEFNTTLGCKKSVNMAPLNNRSYVYQRRPYNRNLPKPSLLKELIGLGIPELISDFAHRGLRTRKELAHVQVLFSQHLDDDVIKQQKKISARLGISITSCSTDATHFIVDKFVRTRNMLEAIAVGKPVVTPLWLDSCGQASCLLDEKKYILRDAKKEKEIGFNMAVSLARARQYPLLKDKKVCITQNVKPKKEMITSLVKAVGGEVVETSQKMTATDQKIQVDLLILSCEQDLPICTPLLEKGAAVYSSELLLNGIVIQKLEYGRHQLLPKFVKEKSGRSRKH